MAISVKISLTLVALLWVTSVAQTNSPIGLWRAEFDERLRGFIETYACGDMLCGRIQALDEPMDREGQPKKDKNNPNPALRDRPLVGAEMMTGFRRKNDIVWTGGSIYDMRDGRTYRGRLTLAEDGTLKVRGYLGTPIIGQTVVWTRER